MKFKFQIPGERKLVEWAIWINILGEGLIFKLENEVSSDMSYFWYSDGVVVMFDLWVLKEYHQVTR